jgi:sugar lactone lactonase YvrE
MTDIVSYGAHREGASYGKIRGWGHDAGSRGQEQTLTNGNLDVLIDGLGFGEAPRWHEGKLWLSDIALGRVLSIGLDGAVEEICTVEGAPSGLGWLPDGRMLVVSMHDRTVLRLEADGRLEVHTDASDLVSADLNDMVVDPDGRAYVSNFGYDAATEERATTGIVLVQPDGVAEMLDLGLWRPNGMGISADGSTFVVAETRIHRVRAFDIAAGGRLEGGREIADLGSGSWADGLCVDEADGIWVADPMGSRCVRVEEGKGITHDIETDVPCVACILGGDDRRTLFLVEAPVRPMSEGAADPRGRVEYLRVDVPGAGRP